MSVIKKLLLTSITLIRSPCKSTEGPNPFCSICVWKWFMMEQQYNFNFAACNGYTPANIVDVYGSEHMMLLLGGVSIN